VSCDTVRMGERVFFVEDNAIRTSRIVGAVLTERGGVVIELECGKRLDNRSACRSVQALFAQLSREFRQHQAKTLL